MKMGELLLALTGPEAGTMPALARRGPQATSLTPPKFRGDRAHRSNAGEPRDCVNLALGVLTGPHDVQ